MSCYGAKELEASFRTVRRNTIIIAEEIPEEHYGFRAVPAVRSVAETLAHIAAAPRFHLAVHAERLESMDFSTFARLRQQCLQEEERLTAKGDIVHALETGGKEFAAALGSLSDDVLASRVRFPPPVDSSKSLLEMLISSREHEMHHRAQLMLVQRMLGMVPHLTRQRQEMMAQGR